MSFLVEHPRGPDEGPSAYRFRLAADNQLSVRQLGEVNDSIGWDLDGPASELADRRGGDPGLGPWVRRWSRHCPACLAAGRSWSLGWEIFFADACVGCGQWLVDTCSNCGARLAWNRDDLLRCDCGHCLTAEKSRAAPLAVVRTSRALTSVAKGEAPEDLPILIGLNVEQCVRVVRFLGTYGACDGGCVPQKVPNVDRLEVSWPISSIAAEVLCTWPNGMTALLNKLSQRGRDEDLGRLGKTFGGFYTALYKSFGAPEFEFLRTAFEGWVAEHWTGPLARRNRRLSSSVLEAVAWMPASYACRRLGVSRRRLASLIDEGRLRAGRRFSAAGREFVVVSKQDVGRLAPALHDGLTLEAAAERLGLKRQRLAALLPVICPEARKIGERGCPWSIPTIWVTKWEELLRTQVNSCSGVDGLVTLGHVISYWPWTDDQVGLLLNGVPPASLHDLT